MRSNGMSDNDDRLYKDLIAMDDAADLERDVDYDRRGRAHRDLTDADLVDAWIVAFKAWVNDYPATSLALDDLSSELRLRNIDEPFDAVEEDMDQVEAKFLA